MKAFAKGAYPKPTSHDVLQLLIFPSPGKCEQGFSRTMTVKSKSGCKRSLWVPTRCQRSDCSHRPTGREKTSYISL